MKNPLQLAYDRARASVSDPRYRPALTAGATALAYTAVGQLSGIDPGWRALAGLSLGAAGIVVARRQQAPQNLHYVAYGVLGGGLIALGITAWGSVGAAGGDPRAVYRYTFCAPSERRTDLGPAPEWLNPDAEVCAPPEGCGFATREIFVVTLFEKLLALGLPAKLAFEVIAHLGEETGFGAHCKGSNLGGWKVSRGWVTDFERRYGRPAPWWRAPGHVEGGDAPTVYYRAYPSIDAFLLDWIEKFIPRPGTPHSTYSSTGQLAWTGGDWFADMLSKGYRGPVTQASPGTALANQQRLIENMRAIYAQARLGRIPASFTLDAADRAAIMQAQNELGVPQTGEADDATATAIARYAA